jgi:superfamily II DNA/RNA helicase
LLHELTGAKPTVVLSDDKGASARIGAFSDSEERWLVAVRMVSEGVDIPRLAVGVYATNASTPLFFAQAVGRFVRARRRGEIASVFLPTVAPLLKHAAEMEVTRDHVLGERLKPEDDLFGPEEELLAAANKADDGPDGMGEFTALGSVATFDRVMFGGAEYGLPAEPGSREEQDYIGLPGLLDADQIRELLSRRQASQLRAAARRGGPAPEPAAKRPVATHAERSALRRELQTLVGAYHHRSGASHAAIHAELRKVTGGPAVSTAGIDDLRRRIDTLRRKLA